MNTIRSLVLVVAVLLAGCHRGNRVSDGTLRRLMARKVPFTLVFGAVRTEGAELAHPTIRIVRQVTRSTPETVLWSWNVDRGGRFFAVVQAPAELPYLDEFYVEAGDPAVGFDRVLFVRLTKGEPPSAMYVGDFQIRLADSRTSQGAPVKVELQDGSEAAVRELKRLYPKMELPVQKAAIFRSGR